MTLNLFKKKPAKTAPVKEPQETAEAPVMPSVAPKGTSAGADRVLKHFFVSEKTTRGIGMNHYTFVVADDATKSEIAKHVEALYAVKVEAVRITRLPKKRRDIGRHPGFRGGLKKAIVVLREGDSIAQAQP